MHIIYRVDGKDFEERGDALDYVADTHFRDASDVDFDEEPDRDGYYLRVYPRDGYEDGAWEPVSIFLIDAAPRLYR